MIIAITAMEKTLQAEIDPRFGRAAYYMIINTDTDKVTIHDNSDGINAANGAGTGAAQTLSEYGVKALYTGRVGPKAADVLDKAGITYYENCRGSVQGVFDQVKAGKSSQGSLPTEQTPRQQPVVNESAQNCPGATQPEGGFRLTGCGRGKGLGAGRGTGRRSGQGMGRGKGMGCQ